MKRIDFEAHFTIPEFVEKMRTIEGYPRYVEDKEKKTRRSLSPILF